MSGSAVSELPETGSRAERPASGRWIAAAACVLAVVGALLFASAVLVSLEYDLEDGVLELLEPAWVPFGLLAFGLTAGFLVFSGVPWRRWLAVLGYGAGAAWLLFVADVAPEWLTGAMAAAVTWGLAALALVAPRSVREFFGQYEVGGGRLAIPLGPLQSHADARRWVSIIGTWLDTGVLNPREQARLGHTLAAWADRQEAMADDLREQMARLAPPRSPFAFTNPVRKLVGRLRRHGRAGSRAS